MAKETSRAGELTAFGTLLVAFIGAVPHLTGTNDSRLFFCISSSMLWFVVVLYDLWAWKGTIGYRSHALAPGSCALAAIGYLAFESVEIYRGPGPRFGYRPLILAAFAALVVWCIFELLDNIRIDETREVGPRWTDSSYHLVTAGLLLIVIIPAWFALVYPKQPGAWEPPPAATCAGGNAGFDPASTATRAAENRIPRDGWNKDHRPTTAPWQSGVTARERTYHVTDAQKSATRRTSTSRVTWAAMISRDCPDTRA